MYASIRFQGLGDFLGYNAARERPIKASSFAILRENGLGAAATRSRQAIEELARRLPAGLNFRKKSFRPIFRQ
jgi:hypothetical protein